MWHRRSPTSNRKTQSSATYYDSGNYSEVHDTIIAICSRAIMLMVRCMAGGTHAGSCQPDTRAHPSSYTGSRYPSNNMNNALQQSVPRYVIRPHFDLTLPYHIKGTGIIREGEGERDRERTKERERKNRNTWMLTRKWRDGI